MPLCCASPDSCTCLLAGCVEQRVDETAYPTPDDSALANNFDINNFTVRIVACQSA